MANPQTAGILREEISSSRRPSTRLRRILAFWSLLRINSAAGPTNLLLLRVNRAAISSCYYPEIYVLHLLERATSSLSQFAFALRDGAQYATWRSRTAVRL
jgi:hypothetical protein